MNLRGALEAHWAASDANDFDAEHRVYRDDAVLEYPQSGERIRGRAIACSSAKQETVHRATNRRWRRSMGQRAGRNRVREAK